MHYDVAAVKCSTQCGLVKAIGNTTIQVKTSGTRQSGYAPHNRPHLSKAAKVEHLYRAITDKTICAKNRHS
jgi:hypothetical protein